MTSFILTLRQRASAVLLIASATTFGHGGCSTDLPYLFDDLGGVVSVSEFVGPFVFDEYVVYEEPYYVDEYVVEDPYYYDDGFGFEFGFDSY